MHLFYKGMDDKANEKQFAQLFNALEVRPSTLRFFNLGEKYLLAGKDALQVADVVFKTTTILSYIQDLPICKMTKVMAHEYCIDLLTRHASRVEIWEQSNGKWAVSKEVF